MKQNINLQRISCTNVKHDQNEIIKVCLNAQCDKDRRLCYKCCEEKIHQSHTNFNPSEIMELREYVDKLNEDVSKLKDLITQMDDIDKNLDNLVKQMKRQYKSQVSVLQQKCTNYIQDIYKTIQQVNLKQIRPDIIVQSLVIKTDLENIKTEIINIDQQYKDSYNVILTYLDPKTLPQEYQQFFPVQRRMVSHKNLQVQFDSSIPYYQTQMKSHTEQIKAMTLINANNKNLLVTGGLDKQLIIWDTQIGQKIKWIETENEITSIHICPDLQKYFKIYVGDKKGFLNIYELQDELKFKQSKRLHSDMITYLMLKGNDQIITLGEDIKISAISDFTLIRKLNLRVQEWTNFDYSPQEDIIAAVDGNGISIFNANGIIVINEPKVYEFDENIMVQLSKNGRRLITAEYFKTSVKLYELDFQENKLILINNIQTDYNIINISWCLNDTRIIYQSKKSFMIMSLESYKIEKQIDLPVFVDITSFMFTIQDSNLNYIISQTTKQEVLLYKPQI